MHTTIDPNCPHCVYRVCCGIHGTEWETIINARFPDLDKPTAYLVFNQWNDMDTQLRRTLEREHSFFGPLSEEHFDRIVLSYTGSSATHGQHRALASRIDARPSFTLHPTPPRDLGDAVVADPSAARRRSTHMAPPAAAAAATSAAAATAQPHPRSPKTRASPPTRASSPQTPPQTPP